LPSARRCSSVGPIRGLTPLSAGALANLARVRDQANLEYGYATCDHEMSLTAYDSLLVRRTAAIGAALGALLFLGMLGTDDVASTHAGRLGRLAGLSSLAGGAGAFLAFAQARSRGELRALSATGVTPARAALGAVMGGAVVGLLGAALAMWPGVDLTPLFPHALPTDGGWVRDNGAGLDRARGVRIASDGAVSWAGIPGAVESRVLASIPVTATFAALTLGAFALPLWATAQGPVVRRAWVSFVVASAAVFVFHLVAAHQVRAMSLVIPPLLLLADGLALHRGASWS
jgi:hypothetical protein